MLTETEAAKKICPMTLQRESGDDHWNCVGSGCMAWRVVPAISANMRDAKVHLAAGKFIDAIRSWRAATGDGLKESQNALEQIREGAREWPPEEAKGYCGAFGRPE